MHIELPDDIGDRIRRVAEHQGSTPTDVIRLALDSLEWQESERAAIQVGIDDLHAGRHQPLDEFDREFRKRNGMDPAE